MYFVHHKRKTFSSVLVANGREIKLIKVHLRVSCKVIVTYSIDEIASPTSEKINARSIILESRQHLRQRHMLTNSPHFEIH